METHNQMSCSAAGLPAMLELDVLIVGAGIAGCATALALKQLAPHLSVAIIEKRADPANNNQQQLQRIGETLPPHTVVLLQQLNLWENFKACGFIPSYGTGAAWSDGELHFNETISSPYGNGWHLDRNKFDAWLVKEAQQRGINIFYHCHLKRTEQHESYWQLICQQKCKLFNINCRFVVDATGRKAGFARHQGVENIIVDKLVGIFRYFHNSKQTAGQNYKPDSTTLVESFHKGWWYSAALPDNSVVVALMTDGDIAREYEYRYEDQWGQCLSASKHTRQRVTQWCKPSSIKVIAAHSQYLNEVAGHSWLAVGDAAVTYDPLSSLGIFKALRMGLYASYAINDYFKGVDPNLKKYRKIVAMELKAYLQKREEYYFEEQRFSHELFWQRRHSVRKAA